MSPDQIEQVAELAAEKAVSRMLLALGIDVADPIEMQKDIAYLRAWRMGATAVRMKALSVAITVLITGLLGAAWLTLRAPPH